jgi:hypothetical protein
VKRSPVASPVATLLFILGFLACAGPATAAVPPAAPTPGQNCVTVVARISQRAPATRVVSRRCGGSSAAAPSLSSSLSQPAAFPCGTCTPLLVVYANLNYGGASNVIYGKSGPCDATGYSINQTVLGDWGDRISSMKWANNCVNIDGFHDLSQTGFCVHWHGNVSYVGARLNDHVYSMHVSAGVDYCNR